MTTTVLAPMPTQDAEQTLSKLEQCRALLQEVRTIQDAKQIHDVAKAARVYSTEHKLAREVGLKAHAVAMEAMWQVGRLLFETPRAPGGQPYQKSTGSKPEPVATLTQLGMTKKFSMRAQQLFLLPPLAFENVRGKYMSLEKALEMVKQEENAERNAAWREFLRREKYGIDADVDLQVFPVADLFGRGLQPDAVITEPPVARDQLQLFSDFAEACVNVPVVILALTPPCRHLPEILGRLCRRLTFRGLGFRSSRALLLFAPAPVRTIRSVAHARWPRYCIEHLTAEADLVMDPFMTTAEVAQDALRSGRRFVGGSTDAEMVADPRRRLNELSERSRIRDGG